MQISQDSVVCIHYTLRDDDGDVIDSSVGDEPLVYLHGHGNIVPGLEQELTGKGSGAKLTVKVSAEDGYGEHDEELVQEVPRDAFEPGLDIEAGMHFSDSEGDPITVVDIKDDMVTIDRNHPLAGHNLNFEVEVISVRKASAEELQHGHVHGEGGHHH